MQQESNGFDVRISNRQIVRYVNKSLLWMVCWVGSVCAQSADDPANSAIASNSAQVGRLIRIKLPITGSSDVRIRRSIDQLLENLPETEDRPTFVFEFSPPIGSDGGGSEFGRCIDLARFLASKQLSQVRTVAYVPKSVVGHAVLVALACEEIIIADDAIFGDAGRGESSFGATIHSGYDEIARSRRTVPSAVALGMLDKDLHVYQVTTNTGVLFVYAHELDQVRSEKNVRSADTIIPAGQTGRFRGTKMRELGFASYLANDRNELANALKIPAANLEFDPSLGGQWEAIRVELNGRITSQGVDRVINAIQQQQELRNVNFVLLSVSSEGGSVNDSIRLANFLSEIDRSTVRTVAFVSREARADASLIAFACDHIVAHPTAVLGGYGASTISGDDVLDLTAPIKLIAEKKTKNWSIPLAFIDPDLQVFRFQKKGSDRRIHLCEEELQSLFGDDVENPDNPDQWIRSEEITSADDVLQLDGERASEIGFARFVADDMEELKQLYQLEETPELVGPNWAFELVELLASPQVAGGLLFIGIFAIYIELSSPGLGIGGFVATICFMLYFWANFMQGTAEVLEIILFLMGIIFVLMEIFVIPGFGIFGLGGGILIFTSLVLATQTFIIPTNEYQMDQLPTSLLMVVGAIGAVFVSLVVLRRHIHRTPILGRVMLMPLEGEDAADLNRREAMVDYEHLINQVGTAATRLCPAGKAMFDDDLVDVVSEGDLIEKETPIRVIDVSGNRITVEPAN